MLSVLEYNNLCKNDSSHFKIYSQNIRSFNTNADSFFCTFNNVQDYPDVFILSETWFKESNVQDIPGFKSFHTVRSVGRSGGVSTYVKNSHVSKPILELYISNQTIELSTIQVISGKINLFILGIYRPHSDSIENFTSYLNNILNHNFPRNKTCIVIGDFNINLLLNNSDVDNFSYMM